MRRHPHFKTVFDMNIEHEINERPLASCAHVAISGPSAAGGFCCAFEIEEFEFFIELNMVFERKVKFPFLSPRFDADVVFRIWRDFCFIAWNVWQRGEFM